MDPIDKIAEVWQSMGLIREMLSLRDRETNVRAIYTRVGENLDDALKLVESIFYSLASPSFSIFAGFKSFGAAKQLINEINDDPVLLFGMSGIKPADIVKLAGTGPRRQPVSWNSFLIGAKELLTPESYAAFLLNKNSVQSDFQQRAEVTHIEVSRFIDCINEKTPLRVTFAAERGLRAKFLSQISGTEASDLEGLIMVLNPEAADVAEPLRLRDYIFQRQEIVLWWD